MFLIAFVGVVRGAADDEVGSLLDVLSLRDQTRMLKILAATEPYEEFQTAYVVAAGTQAVGSSLSPKYAQNVR